MHRYEQVSFIKVRGGRYWDIDPPSDYTEGWHYGEDRACELLQWVKRGAIDDLGFVLNLIAQAQEGDREFKSLKDEGRRGAVFGFWRIIGCFAAGRASDADFDFIAKNLMERRAKEAESRAAYLMEAKREHSERARRAAQARWAKKVA
jgi:hypothetical protein